MRVIVSRYEDCPVKDYFWYACDRDLDLGVPVGHGRTPLKAIEDLLWKLDSDESPEDCDIVWSA